MSALNSIKTKALQGDLEGALKKLLEWVNTNRSEQAIEVETYLTNLNYHIKERADGTLTTEQFSAAKAKIAKGFHLLIRELLGQTSTSDSRFQAYHSFTCNRSAQMETFDAIYRNQVVEPKQYYYLYGLDLHSHEGIFKRIAHQLEGLLFDYLDPLFEKKTDTLQVIVPSIDVHNDLRIYKENVLKKIFRSFSLDPNTYENLIEKDLNFLVEHSPQVKGLSAKDSVCVFLGINDRDWDAEQTPILFRWFIDVFCKGSLPDTCPNFLFFFGIIYEESDSPIKDEVNALAKGSSRIKALPELDMVTTGHLKDWFQEYGKFFPKVRDRKKIIQQALDNLEEYKEGDAFFMEDIQDELQKIIDQVNEDLMKP